MHELMFDSGMGVMQHNSHALGHGSGLAIRVKAVEAHYQVARESLTLTARPSGRFEKTVC